MARRSDKKRERRRTIWTRSQADQEITNNYYNSTNSIHLGWYGPAKHPSPLQQCGIQKNFSNNLFHWNPWNRLSLGSQNTIMFHCDFRFPKISKSPNSPGGGWLFESKRLAKKTTGVNRWSKNINEHITQACAEMLTRVYFALTTKSISWLTCVLWQKY